MSTTNKVSSIVSDEEEARSDATVIDWLRVCAKTMPPGSGKEVEATPSSGVRRSQPVIDVTDIDNWDREWSKYARELRKKVGEE